MNADVAKANTPVRGLLGKAGRVVAFGAACVCIVGIFVSFFLQDLFYAGVNPLAFIALAVTFLALCVSLRIFAVQAEQGVSQERRYVELWQRMESTAERAAADAAGANRGVARLAEQLEEAYASRDKAYTSELRTETPVLYRELREVGPGLLLWVDDVPSSIDWERAALSGVGIHSVWAGTTADALELMRENHFDVIVTDMGRHGNARAGYELLDALRGAGDKTPVLVYSGSKKPEYEKEVERHHGQGATNSPFEILELVAKQLRSVKRQDSRDDSRRSNGV